ncbi:glycosyltransferase [uncultured Mucilaginibacter sp.]|uniref:glycosyltransferase family 2 protein n=1 Tax=uncultured Mucilaginibacter sp. TaxID=797541 RepID=UPI0026004445|nr:glycosyltransferase [uncultured Mucilaginibacter sp.]
MPEFSIVTIVKGRRKQLANLLHSVQASTLLPYDVQVVCMDNANDIKPPTGLNVSIHVMGNSQKLPLAAARNAGIKAAKTDNIIFIDVDCIVSPTLFESMLAQLQSQNIIAAYPLYLPFVPETGNYAALKQEAISHPAREHIPVGEPVEHLQFWSLIFGIQKQTFKKIGGFDESFMGYGAEDTDFAMMFKQQGIKLLFAGDYVLHQYHDKYDPPVNYFQSIIENARRYRQKWNFLPMQRWLKAFQKMGLINIDQADKITVIQKPTDEQLRHSISQNPY